MRTLIAADSPEERRIVSRTVCIINQKGGVGKTTTAVNLAAALAHSGTRCLLVDLDPQANATLGFGVRPEQLDASLYEVLVEGAPAKDVLQKDLAPGVDLLPAHGDMTGMDLSLGTLDAPQKRLKHALGPLLGSYEAILIDCPPTLNLLAVNALVAAQGVLIPMQCEYFALEGLTALLDTIDSVRDAANPDLGIDGILRTMYDPRSNLTRDVSRQLSRYFDRLLYRSVIPRNVRLAEAPSHGVPAIIYDASCRGAIAYQAFAAEFRRRSL